MDNCNQNTKRMFYWNVVQHRRKPNLKCGKKNNMNWPFNIRSSLWDNTKILQQYLSLWSWSCKDGVVTFAKISYETFLYSAKRVCCLCCRPIRIGPPSFVSKIDQRPNLESSFHDQSEQHSIPLVFFAPGESSIGTLGEIDTSNFTR